MMHTVAKVLGAIAVMFLLLAVLPPMLYYLSKWGFNPYGWLFRWLD